MKDNLETDKSFTESWKQEHTVTFTTHPKTRRHLKAAGIMGKRAAGFMQYLWQDGFRETITYPQLYDEAIDFLDTTCTSTIISYIGNPRYVKRLPGRTNQVTTTSGNMFTRSFKPTIDVPAKKGYLEKRGYIYIKQEKTDQVVFLFHCDVPLDYHVTESLSPPIPPNNTYSEYVSKDMTVNASKDETFFSPLEGKVDESIGCHILCKKNNNNTLLPKKEFAPKRSISDMYGNDGE